MICGADGRMHHKESGVEIGLQILAPNEHDLPSFLRSVAFQELMTSQIL
jgi:hypothetical protein